MKRVNVNFGMGELGGLWGPKMMGMRKSGVWLVLIFILLAGHDLKSLGFKYKISKNTKMFAQSVRVMTLRTMIYQSIDIESICRIVYFTSQICERRSLADYHLQSSQPSHDLLGTNTCNKTELN